MNFTLASRDDVGEGLRILELKGGVNFDNAPAIREQGRDLLNAGELRRVVIDVSGVSAANSVLFSVLLRWMWIAESRDLRFGVRGLSARLMDVARVSGLETVIPLETA